MADTWFQARILDRFYDKIGQKAAGSGQCPEIVKFEVGFGLVDEATTPPSLLPIPADTSVTPGKFFDGVPTVSYANGQITCVCVIPEARVAAPQKGNLYTLLDQDDEIVAVCTLLPDWITPDEEFTQNVILSFPVSS